MEKKKKLVAIPTKKSLHRFSKTKAIAALFIVAFGISMIPTSLILNNIFQTKIDKAIAEQISVPDSKDGDYEEWVSNKDDDAIPFYTKYHMWNLTNPAEYLTGNKPVYEEIGPYVFREYTTKYNVKYSSNKEEVSYNSYSTYKFDQIRSGTCSLQDKITNINPGYLGVLNMTKTERNLIGIMAPTILSTVKNTFENEFNTQMAAQSTWDNIFNEVDGRFRSQIAVELAKYAVMKVDDSEINRIVNEVVSRIRNNMPNALNVFLSEWSLGSFPEVANELFQGINIDVQVYEVIATIVTVVTVVSWILAIFFWWMAIVATILTVATVLGWVTYTIDCKLEEQLIGDMVENMAHEEVLKGLDFDKTFFEGLTNNSLDLSLLSFVPDNGTSNDLYSGANTPLWKSENLWSLNDNFSLIGEEGALWFDAAAQNMEDKEFLMNRFSLTNSEMDGICNWLEEASNSWLKNICGYYIQNMSSGLLTTRTVEEWLFEAEDNLIKQVEPELAKVNLFDNCQNGTEALEEGTDRYTIKTGKNNVNEAKETVKYNGEEKLSMWARDIDVKGTDGTQFSPGLTVDDDTLKVFVSDLVRPVDFEFSKLTELYDIKLYRYKFSEELFEPAPEYYMDTNGLAYMYPKYGIPVYLSKPHFLGADPSVSGAVSGMNPDSAKHDTYIDVEPITGITMNARARLQVNFKVTPTDKWYTDVQEAYMPILWVEKEAEIPEEKAEEFKESLYKALELRRTLVPAIAGLGSLMTVIGAMFSYTEAVKRRKAKVQRIKEKYGGNKLIKQPPLSK